MGTLVTLLSHTGHAVQTGPSLVCCPPVVVSAAGAGDAGVGLAGRALAVAAGGLQQGLHARVGVVAVHLGHVSRVTGCV